MRPQDYGWKPLGRNSFSKGTSYLKIYDKGKVFTVVTELDHPSWGRTRLVRHDVTHAQLEEILKNPRVHTAKGHRSDPKKRRLEYLFEQVEQDMKGRS